MDRSPALLSFLLIANLAFAGLPAGADAFVTMRFAYADPMRSIHTSGFRSPNITARSDSSVQFSRDFVLPFASDSEEDTDPQYTDSMEEISSAEESEEDDPDCSSNSNEAEPPPAQADSFGPQPQPPNALLDPVVASIVSRIERGLLDLPYQDMPLEELAALSRLIYSSNQYAEIVQALRERAGFPDFRRVVFWVARLNINEVGEPEAWLYLLQDVLYSEPLGAVLVWGSVESIFAGPWQGIRFMAAYELAYFLAHHSPCLKLFKEYLSFCPDPVVWIRGLLKRLLKNPNNWRLQGALALLENLPPYDDYEPAPH